MSYRLKTTMIGNLEQKPGPGQPISRRLAADGRGAKKGRVLARFRYLHGNIIECQSSRP